jgi:hypothetical protein
MKISLFLASACAAACALSGAAHANLLTNGSFEDTTNFAPNSQDTDDLSKGSTDMTGWTITGTSPSSYISWIGPKNPFGLTASDGSYFLDLTGYTYGGNGGGLTQTITTTPGAHYKLTFELGSSLYWGLPDSITASAGGASHSFTDTNSGSNNNYWQLETLDFTATGASTAISFVGGAAEDYIGLDDVSVVETSGPGVPEPATWTLMLVGVAATGAALRAARRKAAAA